MRFLATAAVAALIAGSAQAATFTYEIPSANLLQTPGFGTIAFGQEYDVSDYTVTGQFDLDVDASGNIFSTGSSASILTSDGASLLWEGPGDILYSAGAGTLNVRTIPAGENRLGSAISFSGLDSYLDILDVAALNAADSSFGIYPELINDGTDLITLNATPGSYVTVTGGEAVDLPDVAPVPLPAAAGLLALALAGLGATRRRS